MVPSQAALVVVPLAVALIRASPWFLFRYSSLDDSDESPSSWPRLLVRALRVCSCSSRALLRLVL